MVGESFTPLGPPLLLWENRMRRGQQTTRGQTLQLLDRIGPMGRFGENIIEPPKTFLFYGSTGLNRCDKCFIQASPNSLLIFVCLLVSVIHLHKCVVKTKGIHSRYQLREMQ